MHAHSETRARRIMQFVIAAGLAFAVETALPESGRASPVWDHTRIDVQNDGISVVFTAYSSRDLLSLTVRVGGPEGIVFDQRVEGPLLEWIPGEALADGHYTWEARAVTAQAGAQRREVPVHPEIATGDDPSEFALKSGFSTADPGAIPIERRYSDEYKSVYIRSGMLRSTNGLLENFEAEDHRPRSITEDILGSLLNMVVRPAGAANLTASSSIPKVIFDRDATNGSDYEIAVGPGAMAFFDLGDGGTAESFPFVLTKGAPSYSIFVSSEGNIGLGTEVPADPLHLADTSPAIRFDDTDDAQVWSLQASGVGYAVADTTAGTVPFVIGPGATSGSLVVLSNGNIGIGGRLGIGTNSATAPLHVRRWNGSAKVLVEETAGTASARELFKLSNNGGPFFIFENTDIAQSYAFAMGATGHFLLSHQQTSGVQMRLTPAGNMTIAGSLNEGSSREIKDGITPIDPATVLAKLDALPVSEWSYQDVPGSRHVGPMAEDFHATFGLGPDERHIAPRDLAGVALAAAKALKDKTSRLEFENAALKANAAARDALIASLEERLARMEKIIPD